MRENVAHLLTAMNAMAKKAIPMLVMAKTAALSMKPSHLALSIRVLSYVLSGRTTLVLV